MSKIVLVTGGARSGKSVFAERYVARYGKNIAYIATAQVYDDEMRCRIDLHRARRPSSWTTYEAPFNAENVIGEASRNADIILFDCLTLYLSNLLCDDGIVAVPEERFNSITDKLRLLVEAARQSDAMVVFVTNEVGMGIVPDNALAREYRDLAGIANQMMAEAADEVYAVICGLAVDIKKLAVNLEE